MELVSINSGTVIDCYKDLVNDCLIHSKSYDGKLYSVEYPRIIEMTFANWMRFSYDYMKPAENLARGRFEQNQMFPPITPEERMKIYDIEQYERNMIIKDLIFATHINISKFNEPLMSRRFLATNDSCLSFVQVTIDPKKFRFLFVSRSTEINKMLPADLLTIGEIMKEWFAWFFTYYSTSRSLFTEFIEREIMLTLVMNNPHYYK